MQIEAIEIAKLISDPSNARKHGQKNLDAIVGSLAKFGQQKPIVVDKNNVVVAGNGTLEAAKKIGWTKINCVRTDLTGPEAIAFALADNRTAELAEWDLEPLQKTLSSLKDIDFDLGSIGFDDDFMDAHTPKVENPGLTDPDEVPENVETRCKPGDLWILGNHRLLCGDSTNVQHVERLMNGEKADMVFTDPPYGIDVQADYGNRMKGSKKSSIGDRSVKVYSNIIVDDQEFDPSFILGYFQDAKVFLWGANNYTNKLPKGQWFVWHKKTNEQMKKMFGWEFELCWTNQTAGQVYEHAWAGVLGHNKTLDGSTKTHPSMKSVQLIIKIFADYESSTVTDLYLGSGSTLIACEKTGRKCYGMEIDPHYCDVIIERWEKFTGKKAFLDSLPSEKGSVNG